MPRDALRPALSGERRCLEQVLTELPDAAVPALWGALRLPPVKPLERPAARASYRSHWALWLPVLWEPALNSTPVRASLRERS